MSTVICPICDARPGEHCYDPHGKLSFKEKHYARIEAERAERARNPAPSTEDSYHRSEIKRINGEIGRLMAERRRHEKALRS